jgi:DNA mismatch repair ATPase MutS
MMQAGMFVGAEAMQASVGAGVFTHFKREEDETMTSGKLDEELVRMREIADQIAPTALLLANEPFAATNEAEGSEIGRQVMHALVETGVRVFLVTHLYDLAHSLFREGHDHALFLRAERNPDGTRTFRVRPGEPLPTSFGEDSYRRIFGTEVEAAV